MMALRDVPSTITVETKNWGTLSLKSTKMTTGVLANKNRSRCRDLPSACCGDMNLCLTPIDLNK